MCKRYLVSYDDDIHYKKIWFDKELVGTTEDLMELLECMFYTGMEKGEYSTTQIEQLEISIFDFPEDITDQLHEILSKKGCFTSEEWDYLTKKDYKNFWLKCE